MSKPPTAEQIRDYLYGLKAELEDKYYTLEPGMVLKLEEEIREWEKIKNIHKQLI